MSKEGLAFIHDHNSNIGYIRNTLYVLKINIVNLKKDKDIEMKDLYEKSVISNIEDIDKKLTVLSKLADDAYKQMNKKPEQPYTT